DPSSLADNASPGIAFDLQKNRWNRPSGNARNLIVVSDFLLPIFYQSRLETLSNVRTAASRASFGARARLPSVDHDEIQIADVDHEPERLARDEHGIAAI